MIQRWGEYIITGIEQHKWHWFALALAISSIVIFNHLGTAPLGGDDCYYAQVAKEMYQSGDYLTPRHSGGPDFHTSKPPVLFWMNMISGHFLGFTSGSMRLPSAVLGYIGVVALLLFLNRYTTAFMAFFGALTLTFSQQYLYHARSSVTDGPFAVFFALSLMAYYVAFREKRWVFYYLWGLFLGAAVMTRQIPGLFVLPVIGVFIISTRRFDELKNPHLYGALLLAGVIIYPWHAVMYQRYGDAFVKQYLGVALKTGIYGYQGEYANPSLNPWYAYGQILVNNYWPWLPLLGIGLYRMIRYFKTMEPEKKQYVLYTLLWCGVPLAIFQLAKVKQYHYINPLYVPFAIVVAYAADSLSTPAKAKLTAWIMALVAVLTVSYIVYPVLPRTLDSREYVDTLTLIEPIKTAPHDIYALSYGFAHYSNGLRFYADKNIIKISEEEMIERIRRGSGDVCIGFYTAISPVVERSGAQMVTMLGSSKESMLFAARREEP